MKRTMMVCLVLIAAVVQVYAVPSAADTQATRYTGHGLTFLHSKQLTVDAHPGVVPIISVGGTNDFGMMLMVYQAGFQTGDQLREIAIRGYEKAAERSGHSVGLRKTTVEREILGEQRSGTRLYDSWRGAPRVAEVFFVETTRKIVSITLKLPPTNHPQRRDIEQVLNTLELEEPQQAESTVPSKAAPSASSDVR